MKVLYSKETPVKVDEKLEEALLFEESEEGGKRRSIPGSIAFVPPVAGLIIAGEVIRDLLKIS